MCLEDHFAKSHSPKEAQSPESTYTQRFETDEKKSGRRNTITPSVLQVRPVASTPVNEGCREQVRAVREMMQQVRLWTPQYWCAHDLRFEERSSFDRGRGGPCCASRTPLQSAEGPSPPILIHAGTGLGNVEVTLSGLAI